VPTLEAPTLDRIAAIQARFALSADSPAIGAGIDAVSEAGHPDWRPQQTDRRWDFEQEPRPESSAWDMGADQR